MSKPNVVIEVIGEGKTDIGALKDAEKVVAEAPDKGVIPILLHKLCGRPDEMLVKRRRFAHLEGRSLKQKVLYAKRQASCNGANGVVFVVDTEGERPDRKLKEMAEGRDEKLSDYPMAIGVAHTCIEAWLLADPAAIARGVGLASHPIVPSDPEGLPAPQKRSGDDPKTVLAKCVGQQGALPSVTTTAIARAMKDLSQVERVCLWGFAPFAVEVRERIRPLFDPLATTATAE
jgi:hypothetical protein